MGTIDFSVPEKAIESISEECPKIAEEMKYLLARAIGVSCKAEATKKDALFADIEAMIARAKKECPGKLDEIEKIEAFYKANAGSRCSGG